MKYNSFYVYTLSLKADTFALNSTYTSIKSSLVNKAEWNY